MYTYTVKVFENNVKANLDDDFALASKFLKEKTQLDVQFTRVKTDVRFDLKEEDLALPNDGTCDVVFYIFDRIDQNQTVAKTVQFSNKTSLCWMPTGILEDAIGYHWKTICHELMHSFSARLRAKGIYTFTDSEMDKYDHNDDPYYPTGNFSRALNILKPYWSKIGRSQEVNGVTIERINLDDKQTTGILTAFNNGAKFNCRTLELPWKMNASNVSAIPTGTYKVKWTFSPRLLKYTYEIQGVPNRSGIRFHSANYYNELKGCIALGNNLVDINGDGELDTVNSKATIKLFEQFLGRKEFLLIIM